MKSYVQFREKAVLLRKEGASYGEIMKELGVSRGILSKWLARIPLSVSQKEELAKRVVNKMARGRMNAMLVNKSKRIYKEKKVYEEEEKKFEALLSKPLFVIGLTLYLSKGARKGGTVRLSSGDEKVVMLFIAWLKEFLNGDEVTRRIDSKGITTVSLKGVNSFRKVKAWQKLLIQYYNKVLGE